MCGSLPLRFKDMVSALWSDPINISKQTSVRPYFLESTFQCLDRSASHGCFAPGRTLAFVLFAIVHPVPVSLPLARLLLVDLCPPFDSTTYQIVAESLSHFLALACSLPGPCRLPFFGLQALGTYPEVCKTLYILDSERPFVLRA